MDEFPKWVPEEVHAYYRERCETKEYSDEYQHGTDALSRVMESESMKKAWQAIAKRSEKVHPGYFAAEIVWVAECAERIPKKYPSQELIATIRKLSSKVRALCPEFEDALGHWRDEPLIHFFGVRPEKAILELADNMEGFTRIIESTRKTMTDYVGKPESKHAKRTYVIRLLSEQVKELYDQPLHDTVAAISGVILDEDVDPELVRKLVGKPKE